METYHRHCENLRSIEHTIDLVQSNLAYYIKSDENNLLRDNENVYSYTKLLSFIVVAWCEVRLLKLIYEPQKTFETKKRGLVSEPEAFTEDERREILSFENLSHKWLKVVDIAICKAFNIDRKAIYENLLDSQKSDIEIPKSFTEDEKIRINNIRTLTEKLWAIYDICIINGYNFDKRKLTKKIIKLEKSQEEIETRESIIRDKISVKLDFVPKAMYAELINLISTDLLDAFRIRNKLAHGQWKHAFENDIKKFSQELTDKIRIENIVELQDKIHFFKILSELIENLCRTPQTFKDNFDSYHKKIKDCKNSGRNYNTYKQTEILKFKRGKIKSIINKIINSFKILKYNTDIFEKLYDIGISERNELVKQINSLNLESDKKILVFEIINQINNKNQ